MQLQEIFGNQNFDPVPIALKLDDLVHGSLIRGVEFPTGKLGSTLEEQAALAFKNLAQAIEAASGSTANIAQVSFFFKTYQGSVMRDIINPLWVKMFPDENDRPTYKFMPAPELPGDEQLRLEFWAVPGERRRSIQIPNVAHTNPIPFGVRIGRYLFSSRCLPMDPTTGRNAEGLEGQLNCTFGNASTLLEMAELSWSDVTQGRGFLSDLANLPVLEERWRSKFENKAAPLHPVRYGAGGNALVYIEIIAAANAV